MAENAINRSIAGSPHCASEQRTICQLANGGYVHPAINNAKNSSAAFFSHYRFVAGQKKVGCSSIGQSEMRLTTGAKGANLSLIRNHKHYTGHASA